jgi:prostatin (serine protease 8)
VYFRDLVAANWLVLTGAHDLLSVESSRLAHSVSDLILHEDFNLDTFDSDVALIRLTSPVTWSPAVSPVCLPPPDYEVPPGTQCIITGWGVAG